MAANNFKHKTGTGPRSKKFVACDFAQQTNHQSCRMSLSKPEFSSQLFSKRFDLKLFHLLDLISELMALQHWQITGGTE